LLLGGTEKYEGSDLAFGNGDFQETVDGDLAEVTGTAALGQYIEIAILNERRPGRSRDEEGHPGA
jgi:hypothetical protein